MIDLARVGSIRPRRLSDQIQDSIVAAHRRRGYAGSCDDTVGALAKRLRRTPEEIIAAARAGYWLYFIEKGPPEAWRIGVDGE